MKYAESNATWDASTRTLTEVYSQELRVGLEKILTKLTSANIKISGDLSIITPTIKTTITTQAETYEEAVEYRNDNSIIDIDQEGKLLHILQNGDERNDGDINIIATNNKLVTMIGNAIMTNGIITSPGSNVEIEIQLPVNDTLIFILQSKTGDILLENLHGKFSIETLQGELTSTKIYSEIFEVETSSGDIYLDEIKGIIINTKTKQGDLQIKQSQADLSSATFSGEISISNHIGKLEVETSKGDISVDTINSDVKIKTGSGDLLLNQIDGKVMIESNEGDLVVNNVDSDLNVSTLSGNITASNIHGKTKARSRNGNIRINEAQSEAEITTTSGDISVNGINGSVNINSESGEVDLKSTMLGQSSNIRTVSGDISIETINEDIEVSINSKDGDISVIKTSGFVQTQSGQRHSSYIKGNGVDKLQIQSMSGDITLK